MGGVKSNVTCSFVSEVEYMQKIEIHHLGSVKEFTSDLLDMNLLIGEQATGKVRYVKVYISFA